VPASFSDYSVTQPDLETTRAQYAEFRERLAAANSAASCLAVVADWDKVLCRIKDWTMLAYIRFQQDTTNKAYKAEKEKADTILPKFTDLETNFKQTLLNSPFRSELEGTLTTQLFAKWECNTKSFSPAIEDDLAAEAKLQSQHTTLTAGAEIEFQGASQWFADNAPELDQIYDNQVKLLHAMAQKLGYDTFTELGYQRMTRIGYGPDEVAAFRNEVRAKVVPFVVELAEKQSKTLGILGRSRLDD